MPTADQTERMLQALFAAGDPCALGADDGADYAPVLHDAAQLVLAVPTPDALARALARVVRSRIGGPLDEAALGRLAFAAFGWAQARRELVALAR